MTRRAKGEGSIWENKRRGGYDGAFTHQGKRLFVRGRDGETKEQLAGRLRDAIADARESAVSYQRQTVAQYLESWLSGRVEMDLRPTTARTYRWAVNRFLIPALGSVRLRDLTPQHVDDAIAGWRRQGVSPTSAAYVRRVLVAALSRAVRKRLLTYNPASLADSPETLRPRRRPFSEGEVSQFLAAIETDRLRALWIVGLMGGLRISEALGLTWDRVDIERGLLTVDRQLQRVQAADGRYAWEMTAPKSETSRRVVEIPPYAAAALERHRREQAAESGRRVVTSLRLVFTTAAGEPIYASMALNRLLAIERLAGLPRTVYHELRHTYGMLLREAGVDLEIVQRMMGHASLAVTSGIYGHDRPAARRAAADALEGLF